MAEGPAVSAGRKIHPAVFAVAVALTVICVVRVAVVSAYYGPTNDEAAHIAAGYNALHGIPEIEIEHPPLARAMFAWPLRRAPEPGIHDMFGFRRGGALLSSGDYIQNLVRVRRGNLVFLIALLMVVFVWTRREFGDIAALIALALVSTLPPILAHASLATTDLAVTAMLPIALLATLVWLDRPTLIHTILLGVAIGIGLLVKFSFPVFYSLALAFLLPTRIAMRHLRPTAIAIGLSALIVWGGYRFDFGTLAAAHSRGVEMAHLGAADWVADVPMPAPLFLGGLLDVKLHNDRGHRAYLFGSWSNEGRWYYFPAVLLFATPLPFLILSAVGTTMVMRTRQWIFAILPLAVLLPSMASRMNLGVRHVMPIYPLLAMVAGYAAVAIRRRWIVAILLAWQLVVTTLAHPNYLGWTNELTLGHPEWISLDSNLDWGQDALPLARECQRLGVQRIGLAITTMADLDRLGMPPHYPLDPRTPARGWVAVGIERRVEQHFVWLSQAKRSIRVGRAITLYEMP
ncbi:MAG TPA: glycosyltransferase family 39 protein [Thermoanaerobaculia bacterium]|nr:glycosyltransferase family 39 protein [Thermoanaerobaculia bacterium]